ncbi:VOC family protein [Arundinibacter roseus]|uniref:VOC family protein n=1 Tax=Arundinibacter roseus TaxID=2070510 RepID=A0A4R4KH17_9BACT|nr:VOC family protein [Arundinibacter roseus]TDB67350.1 VOC family protein [Arundinibacter roseus]
MGSTEKLNVIGIDHPAIAADDVEFLSAWYCEFLGYEKWFKHPKPVWMLKAPDGTLLEVMPKDDTLRQTRTTWTPGWSHLAIRVADMEQAVAFLDRKGIRWESEIIEAIGGGKVRTALDGEGNMIQILERGPI